MNTGRPKKESSRREDLLLRAKHICDSFKDFTDGTRVMFLIHRSKEGAERANNDKLEKLISNNPIEFRDNLYTLLDKKDTLERAFGYPLRIYSSVNSRDMRKAIREFKMNQLLADYYDEKSHNAFYIDVRNRFISSLMKPLCGKESLFVLDIDSDADLYAIQPVIAEKGLSENVILKYPTKNGWHIVMKPFNPALLGVHESKVQKDALILLDY